VNSELVNLAMIEVYPSDDLIGRIEFLAGFPYSRVSAKVRKLPYPITQSGGPEIQTVFLFDQMAGIV